MPSSRILFAFLTLIAATLGLSPAWGRAAPDSFAELAKRLLPTVVNISTSQTLKAPPQNAMPQLPPGSPLEDLFKNFLGPKPNTPRHVTSLGSGFIIDASGYVVTNNHVIEDSEQITVSLQDGTQLPARVVGRDTKTDIALLKVTPKKPLPATKFGDSDHAQVGDWVIAIGDPFGIGSTVTAGIVSAPNRNINAGPYDDFIQTDAPINRGNSGGPLFDMDGNVIGINSAIFSPSGGSVGIAFSIPANTVKTVVAQLKDKGNVSRGWIGVQVQPVTQDIADGMGLKQAQGALVADPQKDGPAAKAGVEAGDVITAVNGQSVKDARELARTIGGFAPGSMVKLDVLRNGKSKVVSLTLGQLPNDRQAKADSEGEGKGSANGTDVAQLGLTLAPAGKTDGAGKEGVVITKVEPKSAAADRGVKKGDVILEVAGKNVAKPGDVGDALEAARADKKSSVLMRLRSGDASRYVAVPLANG